jgi:muconate cycloisomerase
MKINLRDLPIAWSREYDGFEAAMYDLVGKKLGVPAYRLLGGVYREAIEVDYWTGRRTTADAIRKAREGFAVGFHGIKFKCNLQDDVVAWAEGVREACGPAFRIVLDPNTRFERLRYCTLPGASKRWGISSAWKTRCRGGTCNGIGCFGKRLCCPSPCT